MRAMTGRAYAWPGEGGQLLESTELAHTIVDLLSDRKGVDTLLLDVRTVSLLADYFIITTGEVDRHIQALAEDTSRELKKAQVFPMHVEGDAASGWVLVDFGEVVVHIFSPRTRDFYRLEEFWKDARVVVRMQ